MVSYSNHYYLIFMTTIDVKTQFSIMDKAKDTCQQWLNSPVRNPQKKTKQIADLEELSTKLPSTVRAHYFVLSLFSLLSTLEGKSTDLASHRRAFCVNMHHARKECLSMGMLIKPFGAIAVNIQEIGRLRDRDLIPRYISLDEEQRASLCLDKMNGNDDCEAILGVVLASFLTEGMEYSKKEAIVLSDELLANLSASKGEVVKDFAKSLKWLQDWEQCMQEASHLVRTSFSDHARYINALGNSFLSTFVGFKSDLDLPFSGRKDEKKKIDLDCEPGSFPKRATYYEHTVSACIKDGDIIGKAYDIMGALQKGAYELLSRDDREELMSRYLHNVCKWDDALTEEKIAAIGPNIYRLCNESGSAGRSTISGSGRSPDSETQVFPGNINELFLKPEEELATTTSSSSSTEVTSKGLHKAPRRKRGGRKETTKQPDSSSPDKKRDPGDSVEPSIPAMEEEVIIAKSVDAPSIASVEPAREATSQAFKDDVQTVLYRTQAPFTYAPRVIAWFNEDKEALAYYYDEATCGNAEQKLYHTIPLFIDRLVRLGEEYCTVGSMEKDGKSHQQYHFTLRVNGVACGFTITADETRRIYHRYAWKISDKGSRDPGRRTRGLDSSTSSSTSREDRDIVEGWVCPGGDPFVEITEAHTLKFSHGDNRYEVLSIRAGAAAFQRTIKALRP